MKEWLSSAGLPERRGAMVLMCAGEFTPMEIDCDPEQGDVLTAVDDGLTYLMNLGKLPDLILGDFDSLEGEADGVLREFNEARPERVLHLPVMKDDPDTMAAVRLAVAAGFSRIRLYAACGGRMDHMMANIAAAVWARKHGADCYFLNADNFMLVLGPGEEKRFHPEARGMFSIFALSDRCEGLSIRGMHYNIENGTLTNDFPLGQSNEVGPQFLGDSSRAIEVSSAGEDQFLHNGSAAGSLAYELGEKPADHCHPGEGLSSAGNGSHIPAAASVSIRTGYALIIFTYEIETKAREY